MKRCPPGTRRHKPTGKCVSAEQAAVAVEKMIEDAKTAADYKDWYETNRAAVEAIFGQDAPVFLRLLAATSQRQRVQQNAVNALIAYRMLIFDHPFDGFMERVRENLERIREGYHPRGIKIGPFSLALAGDPDAVAIDVHMNRYIYGWDKAPSDWSPEAVRRVKQAALGLGWTPAQTQAAIWSFQLISTQQQPYGYEDRLYERIDEIRELRRDISRLRELRESGRFRWLDPKGVVSQATIVAPEVDTETAELYNAVFGLLDDQEYAFSLGLELVQGMRRQALMSGIVRTAGVGLATILVVALTRRIET
jgi:hypothetical protein